MLRRGSVVRKSRFELRLLMALPATILSLSAIATPVRAIPSLAQDAIQPGAQFETDAGFCTLAFLLNDTAGRIYASTAGHCFGNSPLGAVARFPNGQAFGTLERRFYYDIALIKVDVASEQFANPAMRFWGGPTGVATVGEVATGDVVLMHGYGVGFGQTPVSRNRVGQVAGMDQSGYAINTVVLFGDSGGPILHYDSGEAIGIVSSSPGFAGEGVGFLGGPTIQRVIAGAAQYGLVLTLMTAPKSY